MAAVTNPSNETLLKHASFEDARRSAPFARQVSIMTWRALVTTMRVPISVIIPIVLVVLRGLSSVGLLAAVFFTWAVLSLRARTRRK